jgi:type III pantothenate kinase
MSEQTSPGVIAIDVGTSCVKGGWFPALAAACPQPAVTFRYRHRDLAPAELADQLAEWAARFAPQRPQAVWASVAPKVNPLVVEAFSRMGILLPQPVTRNTLPLVVDLPQPITTGIDRLLKAVAVNRLRSPHRPAVTIDLGTACTVDLIASDGRFLGGAILPGPVMAAQALHAGTNALPEVNVTNWDLPPHGIGRTTIRAITSGVYWSLIGGVTALVGEYTRHLGSEVECFLTGGGASLVENELSSRLESLRHVPHLLLSGLALVAENGP